MRKHFVAREPQKLIFRHQADVPRGAQWAGMGIGKTVSSLTRVAIDIATGEQTYPTLVVAPLLVARDVWTDEAAKWDHLSGLSVMPIVGNEKERMRALKYDAAIYTINYENLPWLKELYGVRWPWRKVILDESTRVKGFRTRQGGVQARALGQIIHTHVDKVVELSGTPAPNGLKDLWGQIWMLDGGKRLGRSYNAFKDRWFAPGFQFTAGKPHEHSMGEIQNLLKDICLTLNTKDWFDIKEPIVVDKIVHLPARAMRLYKEMEKEFFIELEGHEIEAQHAATRSQKLMQLSNGAVYVDPLVYDDEQPRAKEFKEVHDVKLQMLESIIEEAAGMPVLVSYFFKSDLARLMKSFKRGRAYGTGARATQNKHDWNAGKVPLMFLHPASAGHGLSLQDGGNILVFFGPTWNLEHIQQIIERIGPMRQLQSGHDRPVYVYRIVAQDTIDELMILRTDTKAEVQDILKDAMAKRRGDL